MAAFGTFHLVSSSSRRHLLSAWPYSQWPTYRRRPRRVIPSISLCSTSLSRFYSSYDARWRRYDRRAEQNRAAQRAFRERKETHLKELEDRSKNFEALQADYIAGEARRNEVELRARALADRAVQMDARERMLDAREAALRSGTTGEAHQSSTSSSTHHSTTTSTPSNTTGGPSDAEGELSKVKEEMQAMRREMKDREAVVLALRRALEEMSTDNGRLRRAYEAAQQELMLRQPLLPLA